MEGAAPAALSRSRAEFQGARPCWARAAVKRVVNVADIDSRYRHAILFRLFGHLARITRCRSSWTMIPGGSAENSRRVTARAAPSYIWRKGRMSGAFVCASSTLGVETMVERQISASDALSDDIGRH